MMVRATRQHSRLVTYEARPRQAVRFSMPANHLQRAGALQRWMIVVDLVVTLLIVIVAGNDAQVNMTHSLPEGLIEIGEATKGLWGGESEDVLGPEETCALDLESLTRGKEADGDLWTTLGLKDSESLGGALGERVDDRVFGDEGILDNSQKDLNGQVWKLVRAVVQGGETRTAAARCPRLGLAIGSGLKSRVRGDLIVPGDAVLAQQSLQVHIFILEILLLGAQRGVVAHFGLLFLVAAIPGEYCRHRDVIY